MNVDRWLATAAGAQASADAHEADKRRSEWVVCAVAGRVVGQYGRGKAQAIADSIGKSRDVVEQMAAAWIVYDAMRQADPRRARAARRRYSYHRFFEIGTKLKYDLEPADVFEFVESDLNNAAMGALAEDMHNPAPSWCRKLSRISPTLIALSNDGAPDAVRYHAAGLIEALKNGETNGRS